MTQTAKGDNPVVHVIRDGRFACLADADASCRNYPACDCEGWDPELHGDPPAPGHEDVPQDECWIAPWMGATDLRDTYGDAELYIDDDDFPDGPVIFEWHGDYITWEYADDTVPAVGGEDD